MNEARDKFLTELLGKCWHETESTEGYHDGGVIHICKCGARDTIFPNAFTYGSPTRQPWERYRDKIDFNSWDGFGLLWEFIGSKAFEGVIRFNPFWLFLHGDSSPVAVRGKNGMCYSKIKPAGFADSVYEYFYRVK